MMSGHVALPGNIASVLSSARALDTLTLQCRLLRAFSVSHAKDISKPVSLHVSGYSAISASNPGRVHNHHGILASSLSQGYLISRPSHRLTRPVFTIDTSYRSKCLISLGRRAFSETLSQRLETQSDKDQTQQHRDSNTDSATQNTKSTTAAATNALLTRLPKLQRRPTKEELLAAATGFWQRLGVRFKWFSIRSSRPFNTDEISAILSWIFLGHLVWVIVGTTTFFSLAILALNTVFAQETLAEWVGNYLTKSSGIKVVFESAIVPSWGNGVITFRNVFVSRRPGQGRATVSKGSSTTAAAAAAAARVKDVVDHVPGDETVDTNYTQFDLSIGTINVTLSFAKWLNGKGLLRDVEIKGIRGTVDRTNVQPTDPNIDPRSYRHEHKTGDFEIDLFKMEDLLVTVHQPGKFRPFSVSIFSCDLPRLRKQWLFYDLLCANTISGSFDDSLFTIHPRQEFGRTNMSEALSADDQNKWKKQSRIRIDGLNIDHLNRGVQGPLSWLHEGNVDIVADVMFPADDSTSIAKVMSDVYDRVEATVTNSHSNDSFAHLTNVENRDDRYLVMDLRVHLSNVRAAVPLFNKSLSYVNNAFIRPIVAYINSNRAFIPVNCRVVKHVGEFDGSWTVFDSGLMNDLSREVCFADSKDRETLTWIDIRCLCARYRRPCSAQKTAEKGRTLDDTACGAGSLYWACWTAGLNAFEPDL